MSVLGFLDERVFRCRWKWLCDKWDERVRRGFENERSESGGGGGGWSREPTVGELGLCAPPQLTWEDYGWTGAPPGAGASMDWISDHEEDCND